MKGWDAPGAQIAIRNFECTLGKCISRFSRCSSIKVIRAHIHIICSLTSLKILAIYLDMHRRAEKLRVFIFIWVPDVTHSGSRMRDSLLYNAAVCRGERLVIPVCSLICISLSRGAFDAYYYNMRRSRRFSHDADSTWIYIRERRMQFEAGFASTLPLSVALAPANELNAVAPGCIQFIMELRMCTAAFMYTSA
jgi:hypothetical protein